VAAIATTTGPPGQRTLRREPEIGSFKVAVSWQRIGMNERNLVDEDKYLKREKQSVEKWPNVRLGSASPRER
jgi:hypothetical protein